ncbi:MAG: sulfide-dependent adenosine diphosphate thiazole synthase [Candidatus Omnitrophica bacterium]|jgi:thiamine thiazole synthase|nr:sulfide-dependent adenosine diphosphate thiazole synthase [Candidatus Omnitrophota bacterium]
MFEKNGEVAISRAIVRDFSDWFDKYIVSDAVVVGGGPSGLVASYYLAKRGFKTLLIESNNYLGGGFWIGGFLMNTVTFRSPGEEVLREFNISFRQVENDLFVADGPNACSKLISSACDAGVKILNMVKFEDVVLKDNQIKGVVINWTPVSSLPRQITCVDPIALECKVLIDATGHDANVCRSLEKRGLLKISGFGPMDVITSESEIVKHTEQVYPGLIVTGMAVSTVYGIPRMGPTFSAMLLSGKKAAEVAECLLVAKKELLV